MKNALDYRGHRRRSQEQGGDEGRQRPQSSGAGRQGPDASHEDVQEDRQEDRGEEDIPGEDAGLRKAITLVQEAGPSEDEDDGDEGDSVSKGLRHE